MIKKAKGLRLLCPEQSKGATKGPRVSKLLSYCRSRRLTYLEFNYGNLFKIP